MYEDLISKLRDYAAGSEPPSREEATEIADALEARYKIRTSREELNLFEVMSRLEERYQLLEYVESTKTVIDKLRAEARMRIDQAVMAEEHELEHLRAAQRLVEGTMKMSGFELTADDRWRIAEALDNPDLADQIVSELIEKHRRKDYD